ncbi:hypothetical protein RHMOL_Rhmol01G0376500 [Rhododendron molle]|uniref:Uncharacterized protein n=1 Tax=Rhododendron molle TaxID=49168 RepID=A0ACC0QBI6_RHOML|nr:hypothetical protein RHMOL_Rhmol01G0376500 [Rhododendron molle]
MTSSSSSFHFLLLVVSLVVVMMSLPTAGASGGHREQGSWAAVKPSGCQGSECVTGEGEFDMDSEIKRRKLYSGYFICYEALQSDFVPCSQRGQSYYNCGEGADANPYNRGCNAITQCRSDYGYYY